MWIRRKNFDELLQRLANLERAASEAQAPRFDPAQLLNAVLDGQVKQITSTSDFVRSIHDIASERMASFLGRKGGQKRARTAERDARGRMLPKAIQIDESCPLCVDSQTANFSTQQWEAHQAHKNQPRRVAAQPQRQEVIDDEPALEPHEHHHQPAYPLPVVTRPGADSGTGGDQSTESLSHTNGVVQSDLS